MKKILIAAICIFSAANVYAEDTAIPTPAEIGGIVISSTSTRPKLKRVPANIDIVLIIEDNCISIRCNNDHGLGSYHLSDLSTNYSIYGEFDSSLGIVSSLSYIVSETSSLDFYIEFEDGSWCQLTWN